MRASLHAPSRSSLPLALVLAALSSCSEPEKYDWRNRDIDWTYGPTNDTARSEHLKATGKKGGEAIAQGWQCRLENGNRLTIQPFRLAKSHRLFGEIIMSLSLHEDSGKRIETVSSPVITADNATFSFDLSEESAKRMYDVVIWFRKP